MDKKLQDNIWSLLPKEFKEEVKKMWQSADKEQQLPHDAFLRGEYSILVLLFGIDNLTSDADGGEMLTVSRRQVLDEFHSAKIIASEKMSSKVLAGAADMYLKSLEHLFGSKCLPDKSRSIPLNQDKSRNSNLSQNIVNCDKHLGAILKDSFSKEHRLNIATQIISGILSNQKMLNNLASGETTVEGAVKCIVDATMMYTDALIAKCNSPIN